MDMAAYNCWNSIGIDIDTELEFPNCCPRAICGSSREALLNATLFRRLICRKFSSFFFQTLMHNFLSRRDYLV
jgi:hypothetical protein